MSDSPILEPNAPAPQAPQDQSNTALKVIIILLVILLVLCICPPVVVIVILALLGPSIGNIFSNIVLSL
jgi:hypothetical protein